MVDAKKELLHEAVWPGALTPFNGMAISPFANIAKNIYTVYMNFVILVHTTSAGYRAHLADFPERFVEDHSLELTMACAAKAIEDRIREKGKLLFRQEGFPSTWEDWIGHPEVEGKTLMNVDVDLRFLFKKVERVLISIPEYELYRIDQAAAKLGMNRSKFLARAGIEKARKWVSPPQKPSPQSFRSPGGEPGPANSTP